MLLLGPAIEDGFAGIASFWLFSRKDVSQLSKCISHGIELYNQANIAIFGETIRKNLS